MARERLKQIDDPTSNLTPNEKQKCTVCCKLKRKNASKFCAKCSETNEKEVTLTRVKKWRVLNKTLSVSKNRSWVREYRIKKKRYELQQLSAPKNLNSKKISNYLSKISRQLPSTPRRSQDVCKKFVMSASSPIKSKIRRSLFGSQDQLAKDYGTLFQLFKKTSPKKEKCYQLAKFMSPVVKQMSKRQITKIFKIRRSKVDQVIDHLKFDILRPSQGMMFIRHFFNASYQFKQFKKLKETLHIAEVIMIQDFANN